MTTEIPTKNGRAAQERVSELVGPRRDDALRAQAIERIHRLRRFKLHVVAFALGMPVLGGVWVLVEYYEEHTWPSRFASAPDVAGTWDPWFFWLAGIWTIVLAVHAFKTVAPVGRYMRRPVTDEEIDRELERMLQDDGEEA